MHKFCLSSLTKTVRNMVIISGYSDHYCTFRANHLLANMRFQGLRARSRTPRATAKTLVRNSLNFRSWATTGMSRFSIIFWTFQFFWRSTIKTFSISSSCSEFFITSYAFWHILPSSRYLNKFLFLIHFLIIYFFFIMK